ncbi:MAG: IS1634 family transposase [Wenzhouxiangella sp.]|jgi:transposase|nr:IS1634 family transposase [Wenzhouxiangella sp.]
MHIDKVPNRGSRPAYLLRESYREGQRVRKRTLANLSSLSDAQIEAIREVLRGEQLRPVGALFEAIESKPCGHVQAVRVAMQRLGMARLLASRASPQRDRVLAMIAARVLCPDTKLATTRRWQHSTLADEFGVADTQAEDLYAAMDWLLDRQDGIQKRLAQRHLSAGSLVLYDLSSSYLEGRHCPLARLGYNRDGKKGKLQVNYGFLTDRQGCPVAVTVHSGNTTDSTTLMPEVDRLREQFELKDLVLIGDRGMISQTRIKQLHQLDGLRWITALKSVSIRKLVQSETLQLGLFDQRNLFELTHPDYPGERLIACRNPDLAEHRAAKREALLQATEAALDKIRERVRQGRLKGADKIGVAVGKVVNRYRVGKHFVLEIDGQRFYYQRDLERIADEAALDGLYVIRTNVEAKQMDGPECVRNYKALANVERAFRSLKTMDLKVRPIHHRLSDRVRAHIFLCMLAEYVTWHLKEAWRPMLFADEDQAAKQWRDPVAPAQRSLAAEQKVGDRVADDGYPLHSFQTLLAELAGIVRNTCRTPGRTGASSNFQITTTPNPVQQKALDRVAQIKV